MRWRARRCSIGWRANPSATRARLRRRRVRAKPRGDHHGHVSDVDRRAAHADDGGSRARAAGAVPRGAAALREGVSRISARGRLLHEQSREDRLPVRRAVHDLGRPRPERALAQSHRPQPAVLLGVQPRGDAREPDFSVEPRAQREAARHQSRRAIEVPPSYPDTPLVREELARMYDNIADMDGQVGEILAAARSRRPCRQHHRLLLERSRRRRAASEAIAVRLGPSRAAHDPLAQDEPRPLRTRQRSSRQHDRSGADCPCARGRGDSRASSGARACRDESGAGAGSMSSPRATAWTSNTT